MNASFQRSFAIPDSFASSGQLCPLPKVVELAKRYKYRICLEESMSFGVLGESGRGATEHWNVPISDICCVSSSMGNALASIGGNTILSYFIRRLSHRSEKAFALVIPKFVAISV